MQVRSSTSAVRRLPARHFQRNADRLSGVASGEKPAEEKGASHGGDESLPVFPVDGGTSQLAACLRHRSLALGRIGCGHRADQQYQSDSHDCAVGQLPRSRHRRRLVHGPLSRPDTLTAEGALRVRSRWRPRRAGRLDSGVVAAQRRVAGLCGCRSHRGRLQAPGARAHRVAAAPLHHA